MGFGTIIANVIMFISVLLIATATMAVFKSSIEESTNSMRVQSEALSNNMLSTLDITSAVYSDTEENITLSVFNSGSKVLDLEYIDVFVDGFFIPRNISYRTIRVQPSTEYKNPGLLDPNEVLEIVVLGKSLEAGNHYVSVTTQYGSKDEYSFSS